MMKLAQRGMISAELKAVAEAEGISVESLKHKVASGRVIIPRNIRRQLKPVGIGEGLSTKVNVNVGTSAVFVDIDTEFEKAKVALDYGTDTLMDLSTGGDLDFIRRNLIKICNVPFGTVPIYQAYIESAKKLGSPIHMDEDQIFSTIEKHLKDGVDFITVHTGITKELAQKLRKVRRVAGVVSRGGSILVAWMLHNDLENPLYASYEYLLELAAKYDVTLSLGDALRPGSILDAHDDFQVQELVNNARLAKLAKERGVQVMIEGPGHMPIDKVVDDVKMEKALSDGTPYYVLGPLVTDIAAGYDHIAAAIGAALAAMSGVDLICYLTPSEHISLPNVEQVKEGLIAAKIAAHAGDLVKLKERAHKKDLEMSVARSKLDWRTMRSLSFDPLRFDEIKDQIKRMEKGPCTMCGDMCVYLLLQKYISS